MICGFFAGPVLALAFLPLGASGVLTVYTAPGLASGLVALICIALVVVLICRGHALELKHSADVDSPRRVSAGSSLLKTDGGGALAGLGPDAPRVAVRGAELAKLVLLGWCYAVVLAGFSLLETVVAPVLIDKFGYGTVHLCLLFFIAGIAMCVGFGLLLLLGTRLLERAVLGIALGLSACGFLAMTGVLARTAVAVVAGTIVCNLAFAMQRSALHALVDRYVLALAAHKADLFSTLGLLVRMAGPFYAVTAFERGGIALVFGIAAGLFVLALVPLALVYKQLHPSALARTIARAGSGSPTQNAASSLDVRTSLQSPPSGVGDARRSSAQAVPDASPYLSMRQTARGLHDSTLVQSGNLSANFSATTTLHQALLFGQVAQSPRRPPAAAAHGINFR